MDLDLQRFYRINRRVLMWVAFFAIVYLLRHFFALIFLTFVFGFVMNKVAVFLTARTRLPYRPAVILPFVAFLVLLTLLINYTVPRVTREGAEFARRLPSQLTALAIEVRELAEEYEVEHMLQRYALDTRDEQRPASRLNELSDSPEKASPVERETHPSDAPDRLSGFEDEFHEPSPRFTQETATAAGRSLQSQWDQLTPEQQRQVSGLVDRMQYLILSLLPGVIGQDQSRDLQAVLIDLSGAVVTGSLHFLLAILLSFLILWDFDRIAQELTSWQESSVGRFFAEASSSVVNFSRVVGSAFQCQLAIALLNASITCTGMFLLGIKPLVLLTTIVFLFGLIPVLGVFISSVPIILISFNTYGISHALLTLSMIVMVHMLEAYVFNPRIYAARFHLNPVIVLIILLVGHELAGIWGMLLGIPVTHYVLNIAQVPMSPRKKRLRRLRRRHAEDAMLSEDAVLSDPASVDPESSP